MHTNTFCKYRKKLLASPRVHLVIIRCADDTTLFCCLEDVSSDIKELVLNYALQRVHSRLKANRFSLNVKKTNICHSVIRK